MAFNLDFLWWGSGVVYSIEFPKSSSCRFLASTGVCTIFVIGYGPVCVILVIGTVSGGRKVNADGEWFEVFEKEKEKVGWGLGIAGGALDAVGE